MCTRKRKFEDDERQSIPNVLQGEVARLDPKFLVNLDPSHCSNNGTVHLICKLGAYWGGGAGAVGDRVLNSSPRALPPAPTPEQAQPRPACSIMTCPGPPTNRHTHTIP